MNLFVASLAFMYIIKFIKTLKYKSLKEKITVGIKCRIVINYKVKIYHYIGLGLANNFSLTATY